jgi:hypothetical protein
VNPRARFYAQLADLASRDALEAAMPTPDVHGVRCEADIELSEWLFELSEKFSDRAYGYGQRDDDGNPFEDEEAAA